MHDGSTAASERGMCDTKYENLAKGCAFPPFCCLGRWVTIVVTFLQAYSRKSKKIPCMPHGDITQFRQSAIEGIKFHI